MQQAKNYHFTLVLEGVDQNTPNLEDALFEVGCDDALIHFRNGAVYVEFDREVMDNTRNFETVVIEAIKAVESASVKPKVVNVAPDDYVSESDIAKRLNIKRQAVSLWVKGARRAKTPFPKPIMKLTEKSPLWSWSDVVSWLYQQNKIEDVQLVEIAKFIENINTTLLTRNKAARAYQQRMRKEIDA